MEYTYYLVYGTHYTDFRQDHKNAKIGEILYKKREMAFSATLAAQFSDCPLEYTANLLGGKWKIKLIWTIYEAKNIRFNQLKRELDGITDMMLTKILKELVAEDIICRTQFNEIPPHVEYSLTETGLKLVQSLSDVRDWPKEQQEKKKTVRFT